MSVDITPAPTAGSPPPWPMQQGVAYVTPPAPAEVTTQDAQASDEGVDPDSHIEFMGKRFRLAESVGLMPLMQFSMAAKRGVDTDDLDGLAAMYVVIRDCIYRPVLTDDAGQPRIDESTGEFLCDETEWDAFQHHAINVKAEGEDLNDFLSAAVQAISARPRQRRGSSSGGSPATSEKSRAGSSSPGTPLPRHPDVAGLVPVAELAS
jgi:hypothetical protein